MGIVKPSSQSHTQTKKQIASLEGEKKKQKQHHLFSFLGIPHSRSCNNNTSDPLTKTEAPPMRIGSEEELLHRNRRNVDHYLRRLGSLLHNQECSLNEKGICLFKFQKFVVVTEVPADDPKAMYIYTMVWKLDHTASTNVRVIHRAMELNYMESGTRGATLGLDNDEINLCYTTRVSNLTFSIFKAAMENFLVTASQVYETLEVVKTSGRQNLTP